jgi:hypothetical protein
MSSSTNGFVLVVGLGLPRIDPGLLRVVLSTVSKLTLPCFEKEKEKEGKKKKKKKKTFASVTLRRTLILCSTALLVPHCRGRGRRGVRRPRGVEAYVVQEEDEEAHRGRCGWCRRRWASLVEAQEEEEEEGRRGGVSE